MKTINLTHLRDDIVQEQQRLERQSKALDFISKNWNRFRELLGESRSSRLE